MSSKLDIVLTQPIFPHWSGLVWSSLVWSGLVWSGLVWSGHKLSENIWVVWSRTCYKGEKVRCHACGLTN